MKKQNLFWRAGVQGKYFLDGIIRRHCAPGVSRTAYIFIATPRSASQHICNVLEAGTGLTSVSLRTERGLGHFSIDMSQRPRSRGPFLWYQHLFPTPRNISIVSRLAAAPPLISFRPPEAWVLSVAEWCQRKGRSPWGIPLDRFIAEFGSPHCKASAGELPLTAALDFTIDFELPVYLRFLSGWLQAQEADHSQNRPFFQSYRDATENTDQFLCTMQERWPAFDSQKAREALHQRVNYNVGPGRNPRDFLTERQISRIAELVGRTPASKLLTGAD